LFPKGIEQDPTVDKTAHFSIYCKSHYCPFFKLGTGGKHEHKIYCS